MTRIKTLVLYGSAQARLTAKGLLENHPQIRRVDSHDGCTQLRLFFGESMSGEEIIDLLCRSGIDGLQFLH